MTFSPLFAEAEVGTVTFAQIRNRIKNMIDAGDVPAEAILTGQFNRKLQREVTGFVIRPVPSSMTAEELLNLIQNGPRDLRQEAVQELFTRAQAAELP